MVLRADVADETSAQAAVSRVLRSLRRPQAQGFRKTLASDVRRVDLVTPAGIFIAPAPAFAVEPRLSSVPLRIVKGLFFHHSKRKLAAGYGVRALPLEQFEYSDDSRRAGLERLLAPVVNGAPPQQFGNVFTYWFSTVPEEPNISAWVMLFYRKALFVAFTAPEQKLVELERLFAG